MNQASQMGIIREMDAFELETKATEQKVRLADKLKNITETV